MLHNLHPRRALLFGLAIFLTGIFAAEYWELYRQINHLDKVLHFLGGLAIAWVITSIVQNEITPLPRPIQLVGIVGVACLVGVLWEFAEYGSNGLRESYPIWYHYFHGGNLADTLGDVTADIAGALAFAVWDLWL